jgi:hypothetical protein
MLLPAAGCGRARAAKIVHGSVSCGGEKVPMGQIMFVPIDNPSQPPSTATIADGQYRIDAKGGAPLGKYRVQIDARRKTGQNIQAHNGLEPTTVKEVARMGPESYAGPKSPLTVIVTADSDGAFDIQIPRQ